MIGWCNWGWGNPYYYSYGGGGVIYYEGDTVYVEGDTYTTQQFYDQTYALAETGVDAVDPADDPESADWLPLGVYALTDENATDEPTEILQLALHKDGYIAGTYENTVSGDVLQVEGAVDEETQKAAWRLGDSNTIMETGIYNLTDPEAQVLVHDGADRQKTRLLVRLDPPEDDTAQE